MSLVPTDALVRPVDGHDDLFGFRFDFVPEAKAVESPVVTEAENGDLIIEGYAAVFDGLDRQGENFHDGAFERGIKSFIEGQSGLCYHHKHDKLLGRVTNLDQEEGKGLKMRARVDGAIATHPELGTYYKQIKNGSLNALSVGGFFKRALINGRPKIVDVDFTEISVTPVPVHPGTKFSVLAGKALENSPIEETPDLDALFARITAVDGIFDQVLEGKKALPENHDPEGSHDLARVLHHVQEARKAATSVSNYAENEDLKTIADQLETILSAHEAGLHTLAAKIGPIPNHNPVY